jgi:phage gp36-like protein
MPYCTQADLIAEGLSESDLIDLTDDEGLGTVNTARVDSAITSASELIDGYLRGRYTLPLSPVPGVLKTLAISIAIYNLYARTKRAVMPESIEKRYAADIKLLTDIQKGVITLGVAEITSDGASAGSYKTNKTSTDRLFGKDGLSGF